MHVISLLRVSVFYMKNEGVSLILSRDFSVVNILEGEEAGTFHRDSVPSPQVPPWVASLVHMLSLYFEKKPSFPTWEAPPNPCRVNFNPTGKSAQRS